LFNQIDLEEPDILYILPESFVELPFEIFRAFKRGSHPLYETKEDRSTDEFLSIPQPE
jgi:hypothetical protein